MKTKRTTKKHVRIITMAEGEYLPALAAALDGRPELYEATLFVDEGEPAHVEALWPRVRRMPGLSLFSLLTTEDNLCVGLSPPVFAPEAAVVFFTQQASKVAA